MIIVSCKLLVTLTNPIDY